MLFSCEQLLRELYNALAGTHFGTETPVVINSLRNALFNKWRNDISFIIGDRLVVLVEHQSTINPNMPLRFLFYVPGIYEALIDKMAIYRSTLIPLRFVEFYVVYNGKEPLPDYSEQKLSDAFIRVKKDRINLELIVKVININYGHSPEVLKRCETLEMYAEFVEMVKGEIKAGMTRQEKREALQKVIKRSIDKGVLKEFLEKNQLEVGTMLFKKWNWDDYRAVQREEAAAEYAEQLSAKDAQIRQFQEQLRQIQEQNRRYEEEIRRLRGS